MLAHSGKFRTFRDNFLLGISLAAIGGFMNAGGLQVVGVVTSHVTGHWTNFGRGVAQADGHTVLTIGSWLLSFLSGATLSTFLIETDRSERLRSIYARPLMLAWVMIALFAIWGTTVAEISPTWKAAVAAFLCFSLGVQNAMLSRITGGAVRGTHMTGVTTDFGIEIARVTLLARERIRTARKTSAGWGLRDTARELRVLFRQDGTERFRLFGSLLCAFFSGAIMGTLCFLRWDSRGALPVVAALGILVGRELLELRRERAFERRELARVKDLAAHLTLPPPRPVSTTNLVLPAPNAAPAVAVPPQAPAPAAAPASSSSPPTSSAST